MVELSHPFMTSAKTTASNIWTFLGKVMFLLFNMLSKALAPWKKSYDHPRGGGEGDDRE